MVAVGHGNSPVGKNLGIIAFIAKDDLAELHFWLWRPLWTLPWYQLCVHC